MVTDVYAILVIWLYGKWIHTESILFAVTVYKYGHYLNDHPLTDDRQQKEYIKKIMLLNRYGVVWP